MDHDRETESSSPRKQLLCPVLIDREAELAELLDGLTEGHPSAGRAIVIDGDAGVGKSRLCRALADKAAEDGAAVFTFSAFPQNRGVPFEPITEGIRQVLAGAPWTNTRETEAWQKLLPVFSPLFSEARLETGDTNGERAPAPASEIDASWIGQRGRLFGAVFSMLELLAGDSESGSLLLILEDLHWADDTTLEFLECTLQRLGRRPSPGDTPPRLAIVGTYRSESLAAAAQLRRSLQRLIAQRLISQLPLGPLSAPDHRRMVTATLGEPASPQLTSLLFQHSEGNPFITEELLKGLAAAGHLFQRDGRWVQGHASLHLPLSLREMILDRLIGLSPTTREALQVGALIGREVEYGVLKRVTGFDDATLVMALREAVSNQLLAEEGDNLDEADPFSYSERFRFRHALVPEVIQADLLGPERRLLHERVANAMEAEIAPSDEPKVGGSVAGRLAHHLIRAGFPHRAHPYAIVAANWAVEIGGFSEAADYLEIAVRGAPSASRERVELLERAGLLRLALMDMQTGLASIQDARREAIEAGLRWKAASLGVDLGYPLWFTDPVTASAHWDRTLSDARDRLAVSDAPDEDTLRLYAGAAVGSALCCGDADQNAEAKQWAERAISSGVAMGKQADRFLYRAYVALGAARADFGQIEEGVADVRRSIAIGLEHNVPEAVILGYNVLVKVLTESGLTSQALEEYPEALAFETRTGAVASPPAILYAYLAAGRWEEGIEVGRSQADRFKEHGMRTPEGLARAGVGHLLERAGRLEEARRELDEARHLLRGVTQFAWAAPSLWGLARLQARLGLHDEASATYRDCLEWWSRTEDGGTCLPIILDACLYSLNRRDIDDAQARLASLGRVAQGSGNPVATAAFRTASGALALDAGDIEVALATLETAVEAWSRLAQPYQEARARTLMGRASLARARRDPALRLESDSILESAEQAFRRLGAETDAEQVVEIRRRAGLLSQARRRRSMAASREPFGGLTAREREVLQLVVTGQTNRQIAASLYIAEGTAELHVSRILGKLNCSSRSQAAGYAVSQGWVVASNGFSPSLQLLETHA